MTTYHLFISHSWNYSDAYDRLVNLLDLHPTFAFKNFSVPPHNPIIDAPTDEALERAIAAKIAPCSAVLIMAGMYAHYSTWINKEIAIARRFGKPIIAIKPFGAERISQAVRQAAHAECAWSTSGIVNAIKLHA
ncbi:TIR domain-containing protein [Pseudomonas abieticivorans]|uniref:TIR domain-containing protein n=1 Tax=Pseudomonas abieticivorans TaxID=2931382 RepID=UPI0020C09BBE|nr:TIR domain-containing protein [Pseudomonas sp. PIA16]